MSIYLIIWLICGFITSALILKSLYYNCDDITLAELLLSIIFVVFGGISLIVYLHLKIKKED